MKALLFILCFSFHTNLFSQEDQFILNQLTTIQMNIEENKSLCPQCDKLNWIYTPQEAVQDMKSPLRFLGRDLFPGSDSNRTCVFKAERAYILYYNCMKDRKEAPATEIEVISFGGGIVRFYVENNKVITRISQTPRSKYDSTWSLNYYPSQAPGDLDITQLRAYKEKFHPAAPGGACWIGGTGGAQDMSSKVSCFGQIKSQQGNWAPSAESFWKDPGEDWPKVQQLLRNQVETVKF